MEVNVCGVFKECIDVKNEVENVHEQVTTATAVEQNGSEYVDNITEVGKLGLSENTNNDVICKVDTVKPLATMRTRVRKCAYELYL